MNKPCLSIGLALLLGVKLGMGIRGFWYGNAFAGLVPFLIGTVYLVSGRWKKPRGGNGPPRD